MFAKNETNIVSPLIALGLGLVIGATVAMLVAPKSGPDTRSLLREKTGEIKDRTSGAIGDTRDRAGKMIEDISQTTRDRINNLVHRGEEAIEDTQNHIRG